MPPAADTTACDPPLGQRCHESASRPFPLNICSRSTPGIYCDPRCCPCAPAGLSIRHRLPGCAPVPGVTGNTNRHVARMHGLSSLRSSYRRHHPGPDCMGARARHHRRTTRRAHHRSCTARHRTAGAHLLDHPADQITRAPDQRGRRQGWSGGGRATDAERTGSETAIPVTARGRLIRATRSGGVPRHQ